MNQTALKIALVTATAAALTVIGCASDPEETANVSTEQGVDPARVPGAVIGTSGTIVVVQPGSNNPPQPVAQCPSVCTRSSDGKYCHCPLGFGVKSGYVCPYGQSFLCFNGFCACYYN